MGYIRYEYTDHTIEYRCLEDIDTLNLKFKYIEISNIDISHIFENLPISKNHRNLYFGDMAKFIACGLFDYAENLRIEKRIAQQNKTPGD